MNFISYSFSNAVKCIISINILVYIVIFAFSNYHLDISLALYNPLDKRFEWYQFLTHIFVHSREFFMHILFNMFALWMFGTQTEEFLGIPKFLVLYFTSGIIAGFFQIAFNIGLIYSYSGTLDFFQINHDVSLYRSLDDKERFVLQSAMYAPMLGASGAVAGVIGAFARFFPYNKIFIIPFPFPIAVRKALLFFILLSLVFSFSHMYSGIAHFAHIGGALSGYIIANYNLRTTFKNY